MDLLIHDIATACERDAAQAYGNARYMFDIPSRREPQLRLRAGRVLAVADTHQRPARLVAEETAADG